MHTKQKRSFSNGSKESGYLTTPLVQYNVSDNMEQCPVPCTGLYFPKLKKIIAYSVSFLLYTFPNILVSFHLTLYTGRRRVTDGRTDVFHTISHVWRNVF